MIRRPLLPRVASALLALGLATAWELSPPNAQPVEAACTTASCATIVMSFSAATGTGYGDDSLPLLVVLVLALALGVALGGMVVYALTRRRSRAQGTSPDTRA